MCRLPQELIDIIVFNVAQLGSTDALQTCCLLSKQFHASARVHLFKSFTLRPRNARAMSSLRTMLASAPHLTSFRKRLCIPSHFPESMLELLPAFSSVVHLSVSNEPAVYQNGDISFPEASPSITSALSSMTITSMVLWDLRFPTTKYVLRILSNAPNLKALDLQCITIESAEILDYPESNIRLQSLRFHAGFGSRSRHNSVGTFLAAFALDRRRIHGLKSLTAECLSRKEGGPLLDIMRSCVELESLKLSYWKHGFIYLKSGSRTGTQSNTFPILPHVKSLDIDLPSDHSREEDALMVWYLDMFRTATSLETLNWTWLVSHYTGVVPSGTPGLVVGEIAADFSAERWSEFDTIVGGIQTLKLVHIRVKASGRSDHLGRQAAQMVGEHLLVHCHTLRERGILLVTCQ